MAAFLAGGANAPRLWTALQQTVATLATEPASAPLLVSGVMDDEKRAWLESRGCLVFREPAHTIEAVAALAKAAAMEALAAAPADDRPPTAAIAPPDLPEHATALTEAEAMAWLAEAGVPVAAHGVAC